MKVKTTIMIDEDVKREGMECLERAGMSLSKFVTLMLAEYVAETKGASEKLGIPQKSIKDYTLEEFGKLAAFWVQKAS